MIFWVTLFGIFIFLASQASDRPFDPKQFAGICNTLYTTKISHKDLIDAVDGKWESFSEPTDAPRLLKSIQSHDMQWDVASPVEAARRLSQGSIHVYFTRDQMRNYTTPRIIIYVFNGKTGKSIWRVEGRGPGQHLDSSVVHAGVMARKFAELNLEEDSKLRALKILGDTERVVDIEHRVRTGEEPTIADLRFLREVDRPVLSWGTNPNYRLLALTARHYATDLALIFDTTPDRVSHMNHHVLAGNGKIDVHFRNLILDKKDELETILNSKSFTFPKKVIGDFSFQLSEWIPDLKGRDLGVMDRLGQITLPEYVKGNVIIDSELIYPTSRALPKNIDGSLIFRSSYGDTGINGTYLEAMEWPENIGGAIELPREVYFWTENSSSFDERFRREGLFLHGVGPKNKGVVRMLKIPEHLRHKVQK